MASGATGGSGGGGIVSVTVYVDGNPITFEHHEMRADMLIRLTGRMLPESNDYYLARNDPDVPYWERPRFHYTDMVRLREGDRFWVVPNAYDSPSHAAMMAVRPGGWISGEAAAGEASADAPR